MLNMDGTVISSSSYSRITGMYSGFDTDSIISGLMKIEQMKVDRKIKEKTKLEWKRDGYNDMIKLLKDFKNEFMSTLNPSKQMFSATALNTFKATATGTYKDSVTVTAGLYASEKSFSITKATLATSAKVSSTETFAAQGKEVNTMLSLEALNDSGTLRNQFEFDADGKFSFSVNGKEFSFDKDTSLYTMMNTVNSSEAGVKMSYSSISGRISFETKETGESRKIELANLNGSNAFGTDSAFGIEEAVGENAIANGQNASITVKEGTYERTLTGSSNVFNVDGTQVTIKSSFDSTVSGEAIQVGVTRDIDAAVNKIKAFVEGYNKLMGTFLAKYREETFKGFAPLTTTERNALSEKEAELWDTKAKSGLFKGDRELQDLTDALRGALFNEMEHVSGMSLSSIGISFGGYFSTDKDNLVIDEEKLRKALAENPDGVSSLFFNPGATAKDASSSIQGLTQRISRTIDNFASKFTDVNVYNLKESIKDSTEAMEKLILQLNKKEEALYAKFAAMETAIQKAQSQGNWITSQMSSKG